MFNCPEQNIRIPVQTAKGTSIIFTSCIVAFDKLPISQKVMAGSLSVGSAAYFTKDIRDWNRFDTIIPPRMSRKRLSLPFPNRWLINQVRDTARMPHTKDDVFTPATLNDRRIPTAAPNPAPAEEPRISGETSGFLNIP